jgi:hypothetical protein
MKSFVAALFLFALSVASAFTVKPCSDRPHVPLKMSRDEQQPAEPPKLEIKCPDCDQCDGSGRYDRPGITYVKRVRHVAFFQCSVYRAMYVGRNSNFYVPYYSA